MFLYSQYDLHAEGFGLRNSGPADLRRLRLVAGFGSPFHLRARCKTRQQLSPRDMQFRCASGHWSAAEVMNGEDLKLLLRAYSAEATKGVLL